MSNDEKEFDLQGQVTVNTTDIGWIKRHLKDLEAHMKTQTQILVGILVSLIITIVGSMI